MAGKVGELVETIRDGGWCEEQGSLMRGLAYGILDPEGERYRLALVHRSECPACRAYVVSLRGLAAVLPPMFLPGVLGAGALARAGAGAERAPAPAGRGRGRRGRRRRRAGAQAAGAGVGARSARGAARSCGLVPRAAAGCWRAARRGEARRRLPARAWASGRAASRSTSAPTTRCGGARIESSAPLGRHGATGRGACRGDGR